MTTTVRIYLTRLAILLVAAWFAVTSAGCATAHSEEQTQVWSRAEIEQLLAPVALYPDPLLAQLLMAATYPDEIVEAARWSRMNPELAGENAMRAADVFDWDPSVKSLIAFPDLLARMNEKIDWTRALGDAFLYQEDDVMDAVQNLRRRARLAGSLASDAHVIVADDGARIQILFASPSVIYVPYYDSRVVYGRWWWPMHPPVVWAPWPGYRFLPHAPGVAFGFWWNTGTRLSIGFFFGGIDWPHREVRVVRVDSWYVRHAIERRAQHRKVVIAPGRWHHEPTRRTVEPRHAARGPARPAPRHESRRVETRQPEVRTVEVRRAEKRPAVVRQPEARRPVVRQPEARRTEEHRPVVRPQEARRPVEHRPEVRHAQDRRAEPRQNESRAIERSRSDVRVRRESALSTSHPAPQREARGHGTQRARQERSRRPQPETQAASPRAPQREARPQDAQRAEPRRDASATPQRSQNAERRGSHRSREREPQNADDTRERGPQS